MPLKYPVILTRHFFFDIWRDFQNVTPERQHQVIITLTLKSLSVIHSRVFIEYLLYCARYRFQDQFQTKQVKPSLPTWFSSTKTNTLHFYTVPSGVLKPSHKALIFTAPL